MRMITPWRRWCALPAAVRASLAFILSSFLLKGIGLLTTPLFTRLMTTDQYGVLATYTSWVSILDVFALLGLTSAGVFYVGLNDHTGHRDAYLSSTLLLCNLATVVVFAVLMVGKIVFGDAFLLPNTLLWLMFLHFLLSPAQVFWLMRQKYEHRYRAAVTVTVLSALLSQAVAVLGVLYLPTPHKAAVKLWLSELASFVFVVPLYIRIWLRGRTAAVGDWRRTLRFALPLLPHYLAQHVMSSADRILLSSLVSSSLAGKYAVVGNFGTILSVIWNAVNASLVPYTFTRLTQRTYDALRRTVTVLMVGFGAVCVGVCLTAPEVLRLLAPPTYADTLTAVPPLVVTAWLSALYTVFANVEFFYKRSGRITVATVIAMLVNLLLNVLLIPRWHLLGAAYTTLISTLVLVWLHRSGYRKSTPDAVYSLRHLGIAAVATVGGCLGCTALYPYAAVRYVVVGALLVVAVVKRRELWQKLRALRK